MRASRCTTPFALSILFVSGFGYFILFQCAGQVERGLPPLNLPPFSAPGPGNTTLSFTDMVSSYGGGLLVVPVVGVLANIAIAKSFCG